MDKQKRNELRTEWKTKQHEEFVNSLPMQKELFEELFDYLDHELSENEQKCDNTPHLTQMFLTKKEQKNIDNIIQWLQDRGGYCDCEILGNVEEQFEYCFKPKQTIQPKQKKQTVQQQKLCNLTTYFGFSISQVPAPWILIATSQSNKTTYQFQIGKKSNFPVVFVMLESDSSINKLQDNSFLQNYWITKRFMGETSIESADDFEFIIVRKDIQGFEIIQVTTKRFDPIFVFAYRMRLKWHLVLRTEAKRVKNDLIEFEKLLKQTL